MDYSKNKDMQVRNVNYNLKTSIYVKLQYMYMHATIKLQHNNLSHKLALDFNLALNHARINSKHEQEDNGATFSLVV